jgi:peptidoglycan/xylan/chitin deacetylase (PgdA/CDA1 family)
MPITVCLSPSGTFYYPEGGGHLWVYLNWALGLRSLGCRVIWLECVSPSDDGSFLDVALPCLASRRLPAVMFVPTDFIGGRNDFDHGCEPEEAICGWDDLRRLDASGVSVQSHTASHRHLSALSAGTQEEEFRRSKLVLESGLGRPVGVLSYPFGDAGSDPVSTAALLRRAGYRAAFLYGGGSGPVPWPPADHFQIARISVGPDTDLVAILGAQEQGLEPAGSQ